MLGNSTTIHPVEFYAQTLNPGVAARVLTDHFTTEFAKLPQIAPEMIAVPSLAGPPIYSRLNRDPSSAAGPHPAVMFSTVRVT